MVGITFVAYDGTNTQVDAEPGTTLMAAAYQGDVRGVLAVCGGAGGCATCHVYIQRRWLEIAGLPSRREEATLRFAWRRTDDSRLACCIQITDAMAGMTVRVPERQF